MSTILPCSTYKMHVLCVLYILYLESQLILPGANTVPDHNIILEFQMKCNYSFAQNYKLIVYCVSHCPIFVRYDIRHKQVAVFYMCTITVHVYYSGTPQSSQSP